MSFIIFLLMLAAIALSIAYYMWRSNERPGDGFFQWLAQELKAWPGKINERLNPSPDFAIKTKELPEAPPRSSGEHEELELHKSTREEEIAELRRLFDES